MNGIKVEAHPPERGGSKSVTLISPGCCSCCCCCLHSVGSLAFSGLGTLTPRKVREANSPEQNESRSTAKKLYWLSAAFVSAVVPGVYFMNEKPRDLEDAALVVIFVLLMALPLVQLGASVVTAALLGVAPASVVPDKGEAFRALTRITVWTLLGAILGLLNMVMLFQVFR